MKTKFLFAFFLFIFFFQFCFQKQEVKPFNITLEKDLEIGVEEGDDNYMFAGIMDVEVDSKGNIYILDYRNYTVKKYDKKGKFIQDIGQKGQGPGEFSDILLDCCLDRKGMLYVLEQRKVHIFDELGEFIHHFILDFFCSRILAAQDDILILAGQREAKAIHLYSQNGTHLESFGECFSAPLPTYRIFRDTWGPAHAYFSKSGKIFIFNPFKYEICVYRDKQLERKINRNVSDYRPPDVIQTGKSSYSYFVNTLTSILDTDTEILAYYSSKEMRKEYFKGIIDFYDKKEYKFLGSLEVEGYPSALDEMNRIYFRESVKFPKVVRYKIVSR